MVDDGHNEENNENSKIKTKHSNKQILTKEPEHTEKVINSLVESDDGDDDRNNNIKSKKGKLERKNYKVKNFNLLMNF